MSSMVWICYASGVGMGGDWRRRMRMRVARKIGAVVDGTSPEEAVAVVP